MTAQQKEKTKICIVIPGHWTDVMGGAQYQADCLINALIKDGNYEIFYIARNYDETFAPIGYKLIGIPKPFGKIKRGFLYLDAIKILRALKKIAPDIIYQRIGCAYTGISAYYARHNNCKMVWHISSDNNVIPYKLKLSRGIVNKCVDKRCLEYGIRNSDFIIAQSNTQSTLLKKFYGRSATAVIKNFHPIPTDTIEKQPPYNLVWIANLKKLKQPEIFIKLAQDLEDSNKMEFIMVGIMQCSQQENMLFHEQIKKTKNLRYLGGKSQDEVNKILAESHLLVNTSLWEGFSNTFIQAWMRKVPVVSLYVNPDNIFQNNMLGICSGSYEKLKTDVRKILNNEGLLEQMGIHSQDYALKTHSENNANEIISILETI